MTVVAILPTWWSYRSPVCLPRCRAQRRRQPVETTNHFRDHWGLKSPIHVTSFVVFDRQLSGPALPVRRIAGFESKPLVVPSLLFFEIHTDPDIQLGPASLLDFVCEHDRWRRKATFRNRGD